MNALLVLMVPPFAGMFCSDFVIILMVGLMCECSLTIKPTWRIRDYVKSSRTHSLQFGSCPLEVGTFNGTWWKDYCFCWDVIRYSFNREVENFSISSLSGQSLQLINFLFYFILFFSLPYYDLSWPSLIEEGDL